MTTAARPMTMAAHVDIGIALVLGQQCAGKTDETIGDHQTENLHAVGGNALGPGHVLIIAGGTDGAAQLGAEEPVQQRHDGDDKDAADQNGGGPLGAGKQQLVRLTVRLLLPPMMCILME